MYGDGSTQRLVGQDGDIYGLEWYAGKKTMLLSRLENVWSPEDDSRHTASRPPTGDKVYTPYHSSIPKSLS